MAVEMAPELQIAQSQTPAITKAALIAAEEAKVQAAQQEAMMRQVMSMFAPGGMPGQQSLGNMMQPQQAPQTPQQQPAANPQQPAQQASAQTQQQATKPQQPQVSRQAGPSAAPRTR